MQISKAPGDSAGHGMGCHPLFLFFSKKNTKDTIILCYIVLCYIRIKIKVCFFTDLSLMTNTATLNTSDKKT